MFYYQSTRLESVISRRALLGSVPLLIASACSRRRSRTGFRGYAFVANYDGRTIAAVDLEAMAVARLIPLSGSPKVLISSEQRPSVYALSPDNGTLYEISTGQLALARQLNVASSAVDAHVSSDGNSLYVLAREPRALIRVNLDSFQVTGRIALPAEPAAFTLAPDGKTAAVVMGNQIYLADLPTSQIKAMGSGDFGALRFIASSETLIAADRGVRRLSLFDRRSARLICHLPLGVSPDNLCFNQDGGQLFVTGAGSDAVVVVFPFHTPEVAETILAGRAPGPMAASRQFLFLASPASGDVSILEIASRRIIAIVSAGGEPAFIAITPNDQYALILNRQSGDMSVLRIDTITRNRNRRASLLTVIPVGSKPVSAVVRAV